MLISEDRQFLFMAALDISYLDFIVKKTSPLTGGANLKKSF